MRFPLISVVMPAFKCANTIGKSIQSIVKQTYNKWELLIVVEKNIDNETILIIREYCNEDSRIKLVVNENTPGIPGSLNYGISMAKGEYIARMDSDDYSYDYRLERQLRYMENNPDVAVCGSYSYIVSPEKKELCIVPDSNQQIKAYLLFENCITHPSVMFRRDCDLYYDEKCEVAEDYELWLRVVNSFVVSNINEPLIDYYFDGKTNKTARDSGLLKEKVYRIQNKYLKKYLDIDEGLMPAILTAYDQSGIYWKNHPGLIFDVFRFLVLVQEKNREIGYCEESIFNNELLFRWNRFVRQMFHPELFADPKIKSFIVEQDGRPLRKSLSKSFFTKEENVEKRLKELITLLEKTATQIHKVIVYGVGRDCSDYIEYLNNGVEVVCYVDKYKAGTRFMGKTVMSPDYILNEAYERVLISSSKYYHEIYKYLIEELGVDYDRILPIGILRFSQ